MRRIDWVNGGEWISSLIPPPLRGLTAAGNSSATALLLNGSTDFYEITTAAASTGFRAFNSEPGDEVYVANLGANSVTAYPPTGGTANGGSTDVGVAVAAGKIAFIKYLSKNQISVQVG